jgi:cell volume regulation protein A
MTAKMRGFLREFQGELSFLVRSFFLVFLGLMYQLSLEGLFWGLVFVIADVCVRYIAILLSTVKSTLALGRSLITFMCGKGLATAVLSIIPLQYGLPHSSLYILIAANGILLSNIITSVMVILTAREFSLIRQFSYK